MPGYYVTTTMLCGAEQVVYGGILEHSRLENDAMRAITVTQYSNVLRGN